MLENTNRIHKLLAGAVGGTLVLALAVSAGAVPRPGDDNSVRTAAVSEVADVAAPTVRQPGDTAEVAPAPPVVEAAVQEAPATTVAAPKPTTAPPTTKAPVSKPKAAPATTPTTAAPAAAAPAPVAQAAPAKVARRTPSAAEVQGAITQLKSLVGGILLFVSPTPAQIAQAGDQVCTAFDNGQTFAQVKATGLSMIPASVTVTPATADWAVRQAVALYCPGHANKLV